MSGGDDRKRAMEIAGGAVPTRSEVAAAVARMRQKASGDARRELSQSNGVLTLDPARVKPFADQPRKRFRGIAKLAESIRLIGQVTPIIVTPCDEEGYDAELVDGERRLRACMAAKLPVKAVMESDAGAAARYASSVAANFCRQPHDAIEIMESVVAMRQAGWTVEEVAGIFGKTPTWVGQYQSLTKLAPEVRDALKIAGDDAKQGRSQRRARGRMTLSLALLLVPMTPDRQVKALRMILKGKMTIHEARTAVQKMAVSVGARVGKQLGPLTKFRAVANAVDTCYHVVERYLRMPGVQIKSLVENANRGERKRLAGRLERLCESLLMLADEIDKGS